MSSPPPLLAARERVVRLLTDRYADDTLTVEEFEAELDRLNALTDAAALERMADALTTGARPAVPRAAALGAPPPVGVGLTSGLSSGLGWRRGALVPARVAGEGRLFAVMSSSHRAGVWFVPRLFRAFAVMSAAVVDLRDAVLPADGCEIEVGAIMANVKVLLPPDVDAEVSVMAFMGNVQDRTDPGQVAGDAPRVRVTGSAVMAEVQVLQGVEADLAALELDD